MHPDEFTMNLDISRERRDRKLIGVWEKRKTRNTASTKHIR